MHLRQAPQDCYDIVRKLVYKSLCALGGIVRGRKEL